MSRARSVCLATATAAVYCLSMLALAHDGVGPHTHETPVAKAAREMAAAAKNLWASLTPEQRQKIGFDFKDPLRYDWHFIPRPRKGLPLKDMSGEQKALAQALLASGLSQSGFIKAETIISLEQILKSIEQGKGPVRDTELYFFNIFGNPSAPPGSNQPWGWRVEGHHLALNFTIVGDKGAVGGPTFMGTNPAEVKSGPREGLRLLGEEEDLAQARQIDGRRPAQEGGRSGRSPEGDPFASRPQGHAACAGGDPDDGSQARAEDAAEFNHRAVRGTAAPGAGSQRPGQDHEGGRRQDRLRLGRKHGTGPAALLPNSGTDIPDRVR